MKRLLIISVFLFAFLLQSDKSHARERQLWLKRGFPSLVADDKLWIGTPKGLYQYHAEEDTWAVYGSHNGLPSDDIRILLWDDEYLWAATSKGLVYGDIKLNKWVPFTAGNGPPGNTLLTLAQQEDYIWVGTERGAARFDRLIEEWEVFGTHNGLPDSTVYDIAVDGDRVYLATGNGLAEYDTQFEQWRYYSAREGIAPGAIRGIYQTTDFLWLFTDAGISRFNKKLHTSLSFTDVPQLRYENIRDFTVTGEQFWLATNDGVLVYDSGTSLWRPYQEESNLPGRSVRAFAFSGNRRWFVTDRGIAVLDESLRSWQRIDRSLGLSTETFDAVAEFKGRVFLVDASVINYFKPSENRWYVYTLRTDSGAGSAGMPALSLDREYGSFIRFNDAVRFSVSGSRFTYRYQRQYDHDYGSGTTAVSDENAHRGDLKGQLSIPGNRTVNGFYNDTDFSRTLYGVRYKGRADDTVQEINWGDIRYEQVKGSLVPSIGIFGASTRIEAGHKTERFKRSLVSAHGFSGEKTTGFETDFFTGNFRSSGVTIRDVDYIKNRYYRLYDSVTSVLLDEGSEVVYVDDGNPATDTPNTIKNLAAAGVTGDFDRYHTYIDYRMDYASGILQFIAPIGDKATVVVIGASRGAPVEYVLRKPGEIDRAMVNRYFIGGMDIVPFTFELELFDASGSRVPLAGFGLDSDGNGKVDPEFIDCPEGILSFPEPKPFPSSVYDTVSPVSLYAMQARFESEITIFNLSRNNLIRSSEVCIVDGEMLTGGEDYVLDYTSGTLLIIKEGIVAEDSEIEVRYEYYRDSTEKFRLAGAGFGPSDDLRMELNYVSFDGERDRGYNSRYSGVDYLSEFRLRKGRYDLKITPEIARTSGESTDGNSFHLRTDVSSQKVRLFSEVESYDDGFMPLFEREFQLGRLHDRTALGATVYPLDFIDVSADWGRKRSPSREGGARDVEDTIGGKILFSKISYPAVSLSARRRTLDTAGYDSRKELFKGDVEYEVPREFMHGVSLRSLRIYGVWRRSNEDIMQPSGVASLSDGNRVYDNRYARVDFSPADLIQINSYYRGKTTWMEGSATGDGMDALNSKRKVYIDATVDRLRGLNLNIRSQGEIAENHPWPGSRIRDLSLYRSIQSNLRVFPGQWIRMLSPFTFEANYQPMWRGYLRNTDRQLGGFGQFWRRAAGDDIVSSEDSGLYQLRGEWRPTASLFLYTGYDLYGSISRALNSFLKTYLHRINGKVEYRPTMFSLMTLQYIRDNERKVRYSTAIRDNSLFWLENRWSERFQTKVYISWQREHRKTGAVKERSQSLSPLAGITYRVRKRGSGVSTMEIRNDLSTTIYHNESYYIDTRTNSYSNTFAVDYYPASVLVLRVRVTTTYRDSRTLESDTLSSKADIRMTAQF